MMSNLLTRAELSKLEAITNPTRSPEEMKNDDFAGDTLTVFCIEQNGRSPDSPAYLSLSKHHKKSPCNYYYTPQYILKNKKNLNKVSL